MTADRVTTDILRQLHATPGAVLAGRLVDNIGTWTVQVLTPAELEPGMCPIHLSQWGPEDERGLCSEVRVYLTHQWIQAQRTATDSDWRALADHVSVLAMGCMAAHRRGGDALTTELTKDPTAWAKYVV